MVFFLIWFMVYFVLAHLWVLGIFAFCFFYFCLFSIYASCWFGFIQKMCIILAKKTTNYYLCLLYCDFFRYLAIVHRNFAWITWHCLQLSKTSMASHVYDTLQFIATKHLSRLEERPIKRIHRTKTQETREKIIGIRRHVFMGEQVDESNALSFVCVCIKRMELD